MFKTHKPFSSHNAGFPGVPMIYQPKKMDTTFSNELAARLCSKYTQECVETYVYHMRNFDNPQVSLAATDRIMERAHGKAREIKSIEGPNGSVPRFDIKVEFIDVIDNERAKDMSRAARDTEIPVPVFEE